MVNVTQWQSGTLDHYGLWVTYSLLSLVGSVLCGVLICGVVRLGRSRNSADVLVGGLCTGCLGLAVPWLTQCILNIVQGRYAYGAAACRVEALLYFVAIVVQFLCITILGWRNYLAVCHMHVIREEMSRWILLVMWLVAGSSALAMGQYSETVLVASGTYCLFAFSSPAFVWFAVAMLVALVSLVYCYARIFCYSVETERAVGAASPTHPDLPSATSVPGPSKSGDNRVFVRVHRRMGTRVPVRVARRSLVYVLMFFGGWFMIVLCFLYEAAGQQPVTEAMDILLALLGLLHSVAVPLVYGWSNKKIRLLLLGRGAPMAETYGEERIGAILSL